MSKQRKTAVRGFTLVELILTITILAIIVGMAIPLARNSIQRQKEQDLHYALREMRVAIDKFKAMSDAGQIQITLDGGGYPAKLQELVDGVPQVGGAPDRKLKFLRRVPVDPMTNSTDWGLRSYQDDPKNKSWGGQNVFDVYTKSTGTALDGTKYGDW
jgi:general secretion pathway protein G